MWTSKTIALAAGMAAAMTGGLASGASTIWSGSGAISGYTVGWGSDSYSESWTYPGQPARSYGDFCGGSGQGSASSGLQIINFGKLISVKGSSSYSDPGHASSSFTANFTVDFDGVFAVKSTGDGVIQLSGAVSFITSEIHPEFSGFLPAGTYTITGDAHNGTYDISIPSVGSLTTAGLGLALITARRRRIA
jgi:hypothetical protein